MLGAHPPPDQSIRSPLGLRKKRGGSKKGRKQKREVWGDPLKNKTLARETFIPEKNLNDETRKN